MDGVPKSWRKTQQRYRLLSSKCNCGNEYFPLRYLCGNCGRRGNLKVFSNVAEAEVFTFSYYNNNGELYVPAIIEVNGKRLPTRITDIEPEELEIGMRLEPTFRILGETQQGSIEYGTIFKPKKTFKKFENYVPKNKSENAGIIGYGVYIPEYRISMDEIAKSNRNSPEIIKRSIGFYEKAVPNFDQDSATMAVDAARNALNHAGAEGEEIDGLWVGSESSPYAVKPTGTIVAEAIGATPHVQVHDTEFACKAATSMIPHAINSIGGQATKKWEKTMVIGTDNSQAAEGDALDFTVGAGAATYIFGKEDVVASLAGYVSYTTDIPDFWRREGESYPRHGGRFTGEPGYFKHLVSAGRELMEELKICGDDIDYAVFHQPTGKFPFEAARQLGIDSKKLELGFVAKETGNTYSASTLIGMANVLDNAKESESILQIAYGSGAGADAFLWEIQEPILWKRNRGIKVVEQLKIKKFVDYHTYRKRKSG